MLFSILFFIRNRTISTHLVVRICRPLVKPAPSRINPALEPLEERTLPAHPIFVHGPQAYPPTSNNRHRYCRSSYSSGTTSAHTRCRRCPCRSQVLPCANTPSRRCRATAGRSLYRKRTDCPHSPDTTYFLHKQRICRRRKHPYTPTARMKSSPRNPTPQRSRPPAGESRRMQLPATLH